MVIAAPRFGNHSPQSALKRCTMTHSRIKFRIFPYLSKHNFEAGYRLMVRTLVFHTNNVGSIPTGLKVTSLTSPTFRQPIRTKNHWSMWTHHLLQEARYNRGAMLRYSFRFTSIIAPNTDIRSDVTFKLKAPKDRYRIKLKHSYLMLAWFMTMTASEEQPDEVKTTLAILPPKQNKLTLTKAPMAHKTNSKEQYLIKNYNFAFSVKLWVESDYVNNGLRSGALMLQLSEELFPCFETNLLYLKSGSVEYSTSAQRYFSRL